jgi:hypothetical protein
MTYWFGTRPLPLSQLINKIEMNLFKNKKIGENFMAVYSADTDRIISDQNTTHFSDQKDLY